MDEKEIKKLADEHWVWIEGLFESLPDDTMYGLVMVEYLYKTAFMHGYKHAKTENEKVR